MPLDKESPSSRRRQWLGLFSLYSVCILGTASYFILFSRTNGHFQFIFRRDNDLVSPTQLLRHHRYLIDHDLEGDSRWNGNGKLTPRDLSTAEASADGGSTEDQVEAGEDGGVETEEEFIEDIISGGDSNEPELVTGASPEEMSVTTVSSETAATTVDATTAEATETVTAEVVVTTEATEEVVTTEVASTATTQESSTTVAATTATAKKNKPKKIHEKPLDTFKEQAAEEEEEYREEHGETTEATTATDLPHRKFVIELKNLVPTDKYPKSKGSITIVTHPEWAPLGVQRFYDLVEADFYRWNAIFRVVDDFVAQFGINGDPEIQKEASQVVLHDEPVMHTNAFGTLSFATSGPNTRSTQLFFNINKEGNSFLDKKGFAPFAEVVEGQEQLERINSKWGEKLDQRRIVKKGNDFLKDFPELSYVRKIREVEMESMDEDQ